MSGRNRRSQIRLSTMLLLVVGAAIASAIAAYEPRSARRSRGRTEKATAGAIVREAPAGGEAASQRARTRVLFERLQTEGRARERRFPQM